MSRRPRPLLYELVGLGMGAYARLAYRATAVGIERLRLEPGVVLAAPHLSDADVPVLAGTIYREAGMWRDPRLARPSFAVRNDLLLRGYFAGYPPDLPPAARRLLYPIGIGSIMRNRVRCLPIRSSQEMRLVEALRAVPDLELDELPGARVDALHRRAAETGRPEPRRARDVLRGEYADLLWEDVADSELRSPALAEVGRRWLSEAALDVGRLIRHVRAGGALVIFPHGSLSADGGIEPLDPRVGRLLHHARPTAVQPLAVAYDPLVRGRPRAIVAVGAALERPRRRDGEREILAALRRTMPLSCGLAIAHELRNNGKRLHAGAAAGALERALESARDVGRPVDPALEDPGRRAGRLAETLRAVRRLGSRHPAIDRAARTYATAIEPVRAR